VARDNNELRESASVARKNVGGVTVTVIQCVECEAEVDRVENDDPSDSLVEKIIARKVPDRDKGTYTCPNGHKEGLEVR